jgi:hypothetical protein
MRIRGLALILFIVSTADVSFAADFYQGIRQMGMGGAAIAVVNDETSLLLNPIGLGRLREPYITLIDPEVTTNLKSVGHVQDLAIFDSADPEKIYQELSGSTDENFYFRGQVFPSFAARNYGFGFLGKYDVLARRRSTDQNLELNYLSDWAAVIGANHSFWGGIVKVGASGRYIDRVEYSGVLDPVVDQLNMKQLARQGTGLAADLGVSITSPTDWLPTVSVLLKDIGDTSFTMGGGFRSGNYQGVGDPNKIPMTADVAVALFPIWSNSSRGAITVEYDDVLNDGDSTQKLHAGFEINMADRFFFRGGWNRGYPTAGVEYATAVFQIQLAYYGEEIGTAAVPVKDERVAVKTVFRF